MSKTREMYSSVARKRNQQKLALLCSMAVGFDATSYIDRATAKYRLPEKICACGAAFQHRTSDHCRECHISGIN
jgi:hypothetical protein